EIIEDRAVTTEVMPYRDAVAGGAMALFGEKYGDRVRVVMIPGFSVELCGGTHCRATGDIGFFVITQESGVAAGVRRIEALTGEGAVRYYEERRDALAGVLDALAVPADQAADAVRRLQAEAKRLQRENEQLRMKAALAGGSSSAAGSDDAIEIGGVRMVARKIAGLEKGALRGLSDSLRDRLTSGVVVLASENDGKVALVVSVTKDLAGRVHAGNIVKQIAPIVGGGGGGRPEFAEAGGKDPAKIDELLAKSREVVRAMLGRPR
ncbi:MAG: DHHA1 domain-containing protein, partial [Vicinamibacterales bacterium]